jgi:Anaphase-promoting complex, cyclosome, subunit 4
MTNTEETIRKSNPTCKSALSILCAATSFDGIRLYIHGRYPIINLKCTPVKEMTLSRDLSYLSVLQDCHKMIIFSIPAFVQLRYSLQTITALYSSLQSHLHTIKEALPNVLSSWKNTLRPLDTKIDALSSILNKYGVDSSVCSVLFKYILLGKSSNHFNALEQFFSGVQMNDQLFVRMEKTLHNGLANVETLTRSVLLAPALSLALEVNQLYGLEDELLPHTEDLILRVRYLLHSIEHIVLRIVEARFRVRDVCSWFRSAASEIKAIGTAPDSVESDNSRKRRVPQELLNRVTDYFQEPNLLDEGQSPTEALIHSYVTVRCTYHHFTCLKYPP